MHGNQCFCDQNTHLRRKDVVCHVPQPLLFTLSSVAYSLHLGEDRTNSSVFNLVAFLIDENPPERETEQTYPFQLWGEWNWICGQFISRVSSPVTISTSCFGLKILCMCSCQRKTYLRNKDISVSSEIFTRNALHSLIASDDLFASTAICYIV